MGESEEVQVKHKDRGIYNKFIVYRNDNRDVCGKKHFNCDYFVLDLTHDPFAIPAIKAYARACNNEFPKLAEELREKARKCK